MMNLLVKKIGTKFVLGEFSQEFNSVSELVMYHISHEIKVEGKEPFSLSRGV